jgi:hypothetical protein
MRRHPELYSDVNLAITVLAPDDPGPRADLCYYDVVDATIGRLTDEVGDRTTALSVRSRRRAAPQQMFGVNRWLPEGRISRAAGSFSQAGGHCHREQRMIDQEVRLNQRWRAAFRADCGGVCRR